MGRAPANRSGPPRRPNGAPGGPRPVRPRIDRDDTVEILYHDDHVVAINKPPGLVTAAQHARKATALDLTRETIKRRRLGNHRVFILHEVDREASGVLVFARTPEVAETLRPAFRGRRTDRIYYALIEGTLPPDAPGTITIRSRLVENRRGVVESVPDDRADPAGPNRPRAAVTHMRKVDEGDGLSLVRLRAESDHPFQLRAHMAEQGHPIAGDRAYASKRRDIPRLALHLAEVTFDHPATGQKLRISSPTPASFFTSVGRKPPTGSPVEPAATPEGEKRETHWDRVSGWYDDLLSNKGSDHHEKVLIPGTLRLLNPGPGQRILDIACGQGILSRAIAARGASVTAIDASPGLIERARAHGGEIDYRVADAQTLADALAPEAGSFDSAVSLMALMNIEDLDAVLAGAAAVLREGGVLVAVILHPAFRTPRQTAWGFEGGQAESQRQFRRVDAYLGESAIPITMNPGAHASGEEAVTTTTFHRPISRYVEAARRAGLLIDTIEEWPSERTSDSGPRAEEENRARREIPMFLAFRARKSG